MSTFYINRAIVTGNLTADPQLRSTRNGTPVCTLRVANNTPRKTADGDWVEQPNYFDITVWGTPAENAARYLTRGRPIAIDGRLEWREWEARDGSKHQTVRIVADTVQYLTPLRALDTHHEDAAPEEEPIPERRAAEIPTPPITPRSPQ